MKGERVISRDGKHVGKTTGAVRLCQMEGCRGERLTVKWANGKHTHPCTKGMAYSKKGWKIL
jgi:hypothetical protein